MPNPIFQIYSAAQTTETYLDYSSCNKAKKGQPFEFSEKDFKKVVKDKTKNIEDITADELMPMLSITREQALQLIKTADKSGKKGGGADGKLGWKELGTAIKSADVAKNTTFDGLVSFENFQTLVTDPAATAVAAPVTTPEGITSPSPVVTNNSEKTTTTTAPTTSTNESYSSISSSTSGGNKNLGLLAGAAFLGFLLFGLNSRNC